MKTMHADSVFKASLKASFDSIIAAGDALGLHWENIIPLRYELVKMRETRNRLYEKLAPTRFVGYLFFVDALTRRSFGIMARAFRVCWKAFPAQPWAMICAVTSR